MNRFLTIFVIAVVFAAVLLAMQGWWWYRVTQKQQEEKELSRRLGTLGDDHSESLFRLQQRRDPRSLGDIGGAVAGNLELLLLEAGHPCTFQSLTLQMVGAALVGMLGLTILSQSAIGIAGVMFAYIPVIRVRSIANARAEKITEQLPDALELVARSLQAGHGIAEAMRSCAEEMHQPIAAEFGRVYEQNNLGRDFRECMESLTARNPNNFDLKIFSSSVLLQRETGGNLIEILESISNTIRKRFIFHGTVRALTAEARFSAVILACLPWFVTGAIWFFRPFYLRPLVEDPLGRMMLGFIIVWFTLGLFVMREITKVDV
ncbi:MAG TPA: type II secretion system F family protein [Myxococcota bacterium]|nr:type II secretion system F family protein [Myxococcota bacterium]